MSMDACLWHGTEHGARRTKRRGDSCTHAHRSIAKYCVRVQPKAKRIFTSVVRFTFFRPNVVRARVGKFVRKLSALPSASNRWKNNNNNKWEEKHPLPSNESSLQAIDSNWFRFTRFSNWNSTRTWYIVQWRNLYLNGLACNNAARYFSDQFIKLKCTRASTSTVRANVKII